MRQTRWAALILFIPAVLAVAAGSSQALAGDSQVVIAPTLASSLHQLAAGQAVSVVVILKDQARLGGITGPDRATKLTRVIRVLQDKADLSQNGLRLYLAGEKGRGKVKAYRPLWVINAVAVTADAAVIQTLAARPEVARIDLDATIPGPPPLAPAGSVPAANLSVINAPALWALGYQGQGVVIASLDTGVDVTHQDLSGQWRGGTNSWYDPYGQHPSTPTDLNGHGTATMGVMVGGDSSGVALGAAPQAQWIAAKIFNDSNAATVSAIHQGFQWLLDPDGNPLTNDAPNVVNNSWDLAAPGCDLTFEPDLAALVAANITPVFAAGNQGPGAPSDTSPANNPDAFSVGAVDNTDVIASFSSRGPTSCGRDGALTFPDVVAPGVAITTTDLYGLYINVSGTSISAPHVTGAITLLLSAFPGLNVDQLRTALLTTAVDLGVAGADNTFGNGRIDVLAAYSNLANAATATPTSTSTATEAETETEDWTRTPTATPSATATTSATATGTNTATSTATRTPTSMPTRTATATAIPAPKIISFSPTTAVPGETVTITGTNFTNVSGVTFGGVSATTFRVVSATQITATIGTGASGSVAVTTPGGTSSLAGLTIKQPWLFLPLIMRQS